MITKKKLEENSLLKISKKRKKIKKIKILF